MNLLPGINIDLYHTRLESLCLAEKVRQSLAFLLNTVQGFVYTMVKTTYYIQRNGYTSKLPIPHDTIV